MLVSSSGAAAAMPALLTAMSRPPNSSAAWRKGAMTLASLVTSHCKPRTWSAPWAWASFAVTVASAPDKGSSGRLAPATRPPDAAGAAGDQRHFAGQRFRRGAALQLGFFEPPVFDVESLLLGQ